MTVGSWCCRGRPGEDWDGQCRVAVAGEGLRLFFQFNFLEDKISKLTGVSVKIDANFPDGVTPIFSKMCNIKYLHDI